MSVKFSIIIVTKDRLHILRKCLDSVCSQLSADWEVLVIDNGSSDGTKEFLRSFPGASVRHVPLDTNTGFAAANNTGAAEAQGQWLFLLNNDTTCRAGTLRALEEGVTAFPEFQVFACQMIRAADGKVDNLGIHFSRCLRGVQIASGSKEGWTDPREVFGASGGAMLVHRSVTDDIGLFDPVFFAYQEDVDFAVRARLAGYRCLHLPKAVVDHKGGGTSSSNTSLYRYFNQRNMELVLRNIPKRLRWRYGPSHVAYAVYQALKWALRGGDLSVCRAKLDALGILRKSGAINLPIRVKEREFEQFLKGDFSSQAAMPDASLGVLAGD